MSQIHVLHENAAWVEPLRVALRERDLPFAEWFLDSGTLDLIHSPPHGVFYNRMSASSHTRGHRYGPEYAAAVLAWLERHGRRVVNGGRALQLEVSKVAQYAALESHGVRTPRTVAAIGRERVVEAARGFPPPFITKHNRAGKGLGVRLFHDAEALGRYVEGVAFEPSVDGITLIQEYIEAPEPFITRVEFVGGRLLYAVRVDTSQGFELCPADACRVDDAFCPAGEGGGSLFRIVEGFDHPLVARYERVLADNDIHIAGIEFIVDCHGEAYTYDINTNTNYNSEAEAVAGAGQTGMGAIADYLGSELRGVGHIAPSAVV
ncbi:MAG: alpha-L-glutamate ligase [Acidobacteria bacterium]|jgi:hypothetical protein|nr:alpha-L-glutamate ligase [Acidobacteriota bacterium]HJN47014.1 hypothetical protein [Vicinamibacterales bacterium]|tara:strand:+ start:601 stop:1560 length:960 start_codon:yes stop_codon:yes gene_type:complete